MTQGQVLVQTRSRTYWAVRVGDEENIRLPFAVGSFVCLLWDHASGSSSARRDALAGELLRARCRYFVCGGSDCDAWHAAADEAFVHQHLGQADEELDAAHVMTTSHQAESSDDVAFFFVFCANVEHSCPKDYLVIHVGSGDQRGLNDAVVRHATENAV